MRAGIHLLDNRASECFKALMRVIHTALLVVLTVSLVSGCNCGGGKDPEGDGGVQDSGIATDAGADAGGIDSGTVDSGTADSGVIDSGTPDAGPVDSGTPDAGFDAGVVDSGTPDAGPKFDDAGCPLPSGIVLSAADAGIPTTGLVLWLTAEVGVATLDGGAVCRWEDVSGNGRHFTPLSSGLPRLEQMKFEGRAAVVFSTNTALQNDSVLGIPATQGRTFAARTQISDTTRRFGTIMQGLRSTNWKYLELEQNTFNTVGSRVGVYVTANAYDSDLMTTSSPTTHVYSIADLTTGTVLPTGLVYSVNGTPRTLARTPGGNGPSGPGNNLVWDFAGANFTSIGETATTGFTGGSIAEILVYDHALTTMERIAVEAYLSSAPLVE